MMSMNEHETYRETYEARIKTLEEQLAASVERLKDAVGGRDFESRHGTKLFVVGMALTLISVFFAIFFPVGMTGCVADQVRAARVEDRSRACTVDHAIETAVQRAQHEDLRP
jgi:hypothetical protein